MPISLVFTTINLQVLHISLLSVDCSACSVHYIVSFFTWIGCFLLGSCVIRFTVIGVALNQCSRCLGIALGFPFYCLYLKLYSSFIFLLSVSVLRQQFSCHCSTSSRGLYVSIHFIIIDLKSIHNMEYGTKPCVTVKHDSLIFWCSRFPSLLLYSLLFWPFHIT